MKILDHINIPEDLKKVPEDSLIEVCRELREKIIAECSENPGHLGSSLGVIELTVALHYVFNTPYDSLIWDVGHQSYAHKILTGRKDLFKNKRVYGGISGFPKMSESEYDTFGTGHSSTSISAALGMAVAAHLAGEEDRQSVAVIGDGSMTGGMAFEALNNAGIHNANLLVILNDNNMAIDPNIGGMNKYLLDISTSRTYNRIKDDVWHLLGKIGKKKKNMQSFVKNIDNSIKSMLLERSNLFEALGLRYFGPVDGHDINHLVKILKDLKEIKGPKLLHCITTKGKGFKQAEADKTTWHAPGKYNITTGELIPESKKSIFPKFQDVFGNSILELAKVNKKIIGITPAMPTGCSLNIMMREMPERCFDVGIAEQHAVTFSAGLAAKGYVPFCNIYSSFMQRAYDQVIHDVALQKLNVVFCLDRAGLVGADGATHHGAYDLAYLRSIPGVTITAPLNEEELRDMMYTAQLPDKGPFAIRYPRGNGYMENWQTPFKELEIGKGRCLQEGEKMAVISIGTIGNMALDVIRKFPENSIALYDMRFLKPIDEELLHSVFKKFSKIITIEDGTIIGGLGSAVLEFMADHKYQAEVVRMGIPDKFIEHGTTALLRKECLFDEDSLSQQISSMLG
ncbi:1-deoxy-D-xylulose-5-phosphate synthase [Porphyromonadaceae bacterium OttesenSCG-928-L07]|nr:1-deoxy-D-xylulose-5-phosphate synthase [Porphyromonadaceae bacterium OttesenSCG-928-L07]MDL2330778.1 1-deoxy-D-xylulose-5-phosphate synthase [Odoribacter sp. OttesenSCG-928-A06]